MRAAADGPASARSAGAVAFLWGAAEATVFFVVPDVWCAHLALRDLRRALAACLWAAAGALCGALALWAASRADPQGVAALLDRIPGIGPEMVERARNLLSTLGLFGLVAGAFSGVPFKLFVLHAAASALPLSAFLAAAFVARLLRFAAVTLLVHALARPLSRRLSPRALALLHAAAWGAFYAFYFALVGV